MQSDHSPAPLALRVIRIALIAALLLCGLALIAWGLISIPPAVAGETGSGTELVIAGLIVTGIVMLACAHVTLRGRSWGAWLVVMLAFVGFVPAAMFAMFAASPYRTYGAGPTAGEWLLGFAPLAGCLLLIGLALAYVVHPHRR
jgi:hypothetical protein